MRTGISLFEEGRLDLVAVDNNWDSKAVDAQLLMALEVGSYNSNLKKNNIENQGLSDATNNKETFLKPITEFCKFKNRTGTVFNSLTQLINSATICLQTTNQLNLPVYQFSIAVSELLINNFIIGYGKVYPKQAYHKGASCPLRPLLCSYEIYYERDFPNPNLLEGGVVFGPRITWRGERNSFDYEVEDKRVNSGENSVSLLQTANAQLLVNNYISFLNHHVDTGSTISGADVSFVFEVWKVFIFGFLAFVFSGW